MSEQRVDLLTSFDGSDAPLSITKAAGDDSTHLATTAFVQGAIDDDNRTSTGDRTFSGDVTFSGAVDLSGATITYPNEALSIIGRCGYSSSGSVGSITPSFTKGLAFTIEKTETGSCDITIPSTMADTSYQVIVSLGVNDYSAEVKSQTTTSFNITTETQNGTNGDVTDIRFTLIGELA